jgi:hypothetical protein
VSQGAGVLKWRNEYENHGVMLLDYITFKHIVPNHDHGLMLLIWNEAKKGDYGSDSLVEDFITFADRAMHYDMNGNVIFAQLVVNNWPNRNLSIEIDPDLDEYLFPRLYYYPTGSAAPIQYPKQSSINIVQLTRFLSSATTFFMDLPGTIEEMYYSAKKFMSVVGNKADEDSTIKEAESKVLAIGANKKTVKNIEVANQYVRVMRKIQEKGESYVRDEIDRLEKMIGDKEKPISMEKRNDMQKKANVLHNFMTLDAHKWEELAPSVSNTAAGLAATLGGASAGEL